MVSASFPDAIRQWSPPWLGRQSVDIFIPSLNVAIEYHGEQHYRAVAFFGGEERLKETKARDTQKASRLARNGVTLIEWRYDRPINEAELKGAIRTAGHSFS
jgi:hypothetical protein